MSGKVYLLLSAVAMTLFVGCRRHAYHDIEYRYGSLRIVFDWDGYVDIPPGMNLMFYPLEDSYNNGSTPIKHQLQYDGGKISLPVGKYNVLVYNDYTYNICYRGMECFNTAEAYLEPHTRLPLSRSIPVVRSVTEPDIFYAARIMELNVSGEEQVVTVRPVLKTLKLFVHAGIDGIQYVSQADGSVTGAAGNVMLCTGQTSDPTPSKRIFSFSVGGSGLYAETRTFLCANPMEEYYELELAFLLRNNSVSMGKFKYDVTRQIVGKLREHNGKIPPEGIHIYIDEVKVDEVSGDGFDAVVDSWGDEVNIELK